MVIEVRVAAHSGGDATRFELERDNPFAVGDFLPQFNMTYQVTRVLPGNDDYDQVVEAEWRMGPAQVGRG